MHKIFLASVFLFATQLSAQVTWSGDVAAIFYKNCTNCHNPTGIAPFSLLDYNTASSWAGASLAYVNAGLMPPWKPDTTYQRFVHERVLTNSEKSKLADWVQNGTPSGNLNEAPAPPVYSSDAILGPPDLKVTMPVYTSKATANSDDYICIVVPSGLTEDRKIKAVEVVPGNRKILHHTLVFIDESRQYQSDTIGGDCASPTAGKMVTGYAPGGQPTVFPNGEAFKTGMTFPANSNVIMAMHYPEGSAGEKDSTSVNFYFYDKGDTAVREISAAPLLENWGFCIPPNTTKEVDDWFPHSVVGVPQDVSLLSIFPHSHLLGKEMESYVLSADDDTTRLIRIPHWDFEWQDFYFFKKIKKLEQGSRLYGRATYDNTTGNAHNPHDPPQQVCAGLNTSDEMFLFYFHYMPYRPGDEHVNIDSLMQVSVGLLEREVAKRQLVQVYPNPATDEVVLKYSLAQNAFVNLFLYDSSGKLVRRLVSKKQSPGEQLVRWDRRTDAGGTAPAGFYFYSLKVDNQVSSGKLLVKGGY